MKGILLMSSWIVADPAGIDKGPILRYQGGIVLCGFERRVGMSVDLLARSTPANFEAISGVRVEYSGTQLLLRLELKSQLQPEWLKRLDRAILITQTVAIPCQLRWIDTDGNLVSAEILRLNEQSPELPVPQGPFVNVDHVALCWGGSAHTKENKTSLNAFRLRDTLPEDKCC